MRYNVKYIFYDFFLWFVSYYYMTLHNFLVVLIDFLLFLLFYWDYTIVGRVRVFFVS